MSGRGRMRLGKRLAFALLTILLLLPLTELGLRLFNVTVDSGGPVFVDRVLYQSLGGKDAEWDEYITLGAKVYPLTPQNYNIARSPGSKPAGVTRIVALGDSSTIGDQVQPHQAYPQVLGRTLPGCFPDANIEVWNLGRHGYTSYQGRLLVEQLWETLQPDVLIFYFGANDASPAPIRSDKEWSQVPAWSLSLHRKLYVNSRLYRLLRNVNVSYMRSRVQHVFREGPLPMNPHCRVSEADFRQNRDALKARVEASGGSFIQISSAGLTGEKIVPGPFFLEWQPGPRDIDLQALFSAERQAGRNPLADTVHPNAHGHRLLAREIAARLAAMWGAENCPARAFMEDGDGRSG
ncbi:MAG: SGNH/GDSL hydrolase family protein [Candidatus Lernaella stagnicola]|nr:SGNH/GDSL hydrolase family protein [Candidatus Lernaella stagnicola]